MKFLLVNCPALTLSKTIWAIGSCALISLLDLPTLTALACNTKEHCMVVYILIEQWDRMGEGRGSLNVDVYDTEDKAETALAALVADNDDEDTSYYIDVYTVN
jgi:hypothetical protein